MTKFDLDDDQDLIQIVKHGADIDSSHARSATRELFELASPPTAIFAGNDNMALGTLDYLAATQVKVPEEVAVVGFDNIWFGRITAVPLTTIDSQAHAIGATAARILLSRIKDPAYEAGSGDFIRHTAEPKLVRRRSCGCSPVGLGAAPNT